MSQHSCCVPGCPVLKDSGVPLHRFPNPETDAEKFRSWILNIGGEVTLLDYRTIFINRRVCHRHFQDIHKYPKNRLSKIAILVLHIPVSQSQPLGDAVVVLNSDVQAQAHSEEVLPSDSDVQAQTLIEEVVASTSGVEAQTLIEEVVASTSDVQAQTLIEEFVASTSGVQAQTLIEEVVASTSSVQEQIFIEEIVASTSGVRANPLGLAEKQPIGAILSEPVLSSACTDLKTQSNIIITGHSNAQQSQSDQSQGQHVNNYKEQKNKIRTKSKGTHVTFTEQKEYKTIVKKLRKCEKEKRSFKAKYILARKLTKTTAFNIVCKKMSNTAKLFCQMQATQSGKQKQGRRFTLDEKILALSLYKPSPKAYRLLSNICVMPSRRTLQNLLHKIDLEAGVNDLIFDNLKSRVAKMPESYKYCSLVFDEMAIGCGIAYDKKKDKISGFVDNGNVVEKEYCDHVLVFMVRGIVKKYKQPLAYFYCNGSTKAVELKNQIKIIIRRVQETVLKVVATICDQGASNVAAINSLLKETRETYIRNKKEYKGGFFKVDNHIIFPLYDPPHLIKGIRNNVLTKNLKFTMKGKECTAKWSHIVALYNRCPGFRGVKLVPKLTAHHVLHELIPKMRVKHCTQVFSHSVGVAIGFMAECGKLEKESTDTAELLMFFDELFDSVNGSFSNVVGGKIYRAAVTPTSPHHKLWNYSLPIIKTMKFVNGNNQGVVPSLSSWIKTIEGFKLIVRYLYSKGINSLLLRNLNQDALENFFGAIRAHGYRNIMPTSTAFEGAFKTLLINNISSSHSVGSNCEKDDSICLQSLKYFLVKHGDDKTPTECENEIDFAHLNMQLLNTDDLIMSQTPMNVERSAAIGYCSGWMAQLAKKHVYKNCVACQNNMEAENLQSFHRYIKMKEYENKKWLCYPTRALFDFFAQVENICIEILKEHSNKKNIAAYIRLIINININMKFLTCAEHNDQLSKYLINKSTMFFIHNWCKDVNNVLAGKITFWDINDPMKVKANRHYSKNKGRKRQN